MVISVCIFLGGSLLAYTPHTGIHSLDLDDDKSAFPIFNIHVKVSVDLSKSDFFLPYNAGHNKDTKPLWCDLFLDSEVQLNQKLHSVRGLPKL